MPHISTQGVRSMNKIIILLTILLIVPFGGASQQRPLENAQQQSKPILPPGNWTLACGPRRTPGEVVDLYSVSTDAAKGLTVTEVSLENRSTQEVAAVKIGLKLYERSNRQTVLLSGETPDFLGVALAPGEKRVITFPVLSFSKIYRPLLRGGKLEGQYKIELWVTDVKFEAPNPDQGDRRVNLLVSSWHGNANTRVVKVISRPATPKDDFGCPNQECGWSNQDQCEKCYGETGSTCAWTDCT